MPRPDRAQRFGARDTMRDGGGPMVFAILADDGCAPVQLHDDPAHAETPERRLALAVLEDALDIVRRGGRFYSRSDEGAKLYAEAVRWLEDDEPDYVFAFVPICELLGFNATQLRQFALAIAAASGTAT